MDGNSEKTIDLVCLPLMMTHAAAGGMTRSFQGAQTGFFLFFPRDWKGLKLHSWVIVEKMFHISHFVFVKEELPSNLWTMWINSSTIRVVTPKT